MPLTLPGPVNIITAEFNMKINKLSIMSHGLVTGAVFLAALLLTVPPAVPAEEAPAPAGQAAEEREPPAAVPMLPVRPPSPPGGAPGATPPGKGLKIEGEKFVGLNFDFADLPVVIQTMAELLNINYILSPGVTGKVTIQTSGKIAVSDLFFVMEKILEVNNLTAVKTGDFYKIIPISGVGREALPVVGPDQKPPSEQTIIKIFKLRQTLPSEIIRLFGNLKSPQGIFIPHDNAGLLFLVESASRAEMFANLIESVDVDAYQNVQVELYQVANAQAEELARDLTQVLSMVTTVPGRPAARFKIIPIKAINAILFVTTEAGLSGLMRNWVKELDQPATTESEKIFVYNLNHASAENVAGILRELYSEKATGAAAVKTPAASPAERERAAAKTVVQPAAAAVAPVEDAVSGKVKIVADKDTNSLIIQTAPWNYPAILETVRKLDKTPEQVLIEVTIAEISLDDTDKLGIEWALQGQGTATVGGQTLNLNTQAQAVFNKGGPGVMTPGFSYLVSEASRVTAVLNAYAKASKLNIISRPHIIASDNKEAKIDVGQEVPIITSQQTSTEGTATTNTIEYRSTGVILTVTPRINDNRDVTLDVTQEVSQAQTNELGGSNSPIIQKRTAKTSMVVRDNETLIIGGLIQEKKERSREGIPLLSRIPILGYLFGSTIDTMSKTELVVLMTPRVITNYEEASRITREYQDKILILKKGAPKP